MIDRPSVLDASLDGVRTALEGIDPRPYRARQIRHWLVRRLAPSFEEMSDLPRVLRDALSDRLVIGDPEVIEVRRAPDGTSKVALAYADGSVVEAVVMPMEGRTTICLSSQTGCAVGCAFCVTGVLGTGRNLTPWEIFGQYRVLMHSERLLQTPVNVVFMGMGEPLLNTAALIPSLDLLAETVSPRRTTVSTSGIIPGIARLASLPRRPNLAVSLNATTQEQRATLMPVAARWPLEELIEALRCYPLERGRRITIEYVMLAGVNDSHDDASRLPRLLRGIPIKVNLIPFNPDPVYLHHFAAPTPDRVDQFAAALVDAHVNVTVRWSKGREIAGACGQLRGRVGPFSSRSGER